MKHHLAGALCPYGSESYLRSVQKKLGKIFGRDENSV